MHETSRTTVVDVTYLCDATCLYCRWGYEKTPGRITPDIKDVLIPKETLHNLGTERVVISGGEPTLHPDINSILTHYKDLVDEVVIITNGYRLNMDMVKSLMLAGATGFTVSIDSVDSGESFLTRRTESALHKSILENMSRICNKDRDFELGINSTISHITANWNTVSRMLEFGENMGVDFVKFQPVFDDGFVSENSPDLLLTGLDVPNLLEIARNLELIDHPMTNPPGFWRDVAAMANGDSLPASGCRIDSKDSISVSGNLGMCYWVNQSSYGSSSKVITRDDIRKIQDGFEKEKLRCNVDYHCFCNQRISHVWMK